MDEPREFPGVYATVAELMWHCIKTSVLTVDQFARFLEAYYRARVWEESGEAEAPPVPDAPVIPPVSNSDHTAPVPPEGEDEPQDPPKPERPENPIARKKRRILGELESRRAHGAGLQDIVDAGRGKVSMELLLSALESRPLPVSDWEQIDKALHAAKKKAAPKEAAHE